MTEHEFRALAVLDRVEMRAFQMPDSLPADGNAKATIVWRRARVHHVEHGQVILWFTEPPLDRLAVSVGQCAGLRSSATHGGGRR